MNRDGISYLKRYVSFRLFRVFVIIFRPGDAKTYD